MKPHRPIVQRMPTLSSLSLTLLVGAPLLLFLVYPLCYLLQRAFVADGHLSFRYFELLLKTPGFFDSFLNSFNLSLLALFFASAIALPLAFATHRRLLPASPIALLMVLPLVLPPFVGAIGIRRMLARFGPLNLILLQTGVLTEPIDFIGAAGLCGVAFTEALHLFPILYFNLAASLSRLDPALLQAADTCGASPFFRFRRVTLPLVMPGYLAGAVIVLVWAFTDLGTPLVFNLQNVIPVRIFAQAADLQSNPSAYALVSLVLLIAVGAFTASRFLHQSSELQTGRTFLSEEHEKHPLMRRIAGYALAAPVFLLALLPHISVLLHAFSARWFMTVLPDQFTMAHVWTVLHHPLTRQSIENSLLLSVSSTAICIVLATALSWAAARTNNMLVPLLDVLAMAPLAIPGLVLAFGYLGAFYGSPLDPRAGPFPLLILGYAIRRLPFTLRSASAGFAQCSKTLEEAAYLSGASPFKTFRKVTLPLIFPHLMAGATLSFSFAMLEVSESLVLAFQERHYPMAKAMYSVLSRPDGPSVASAMGVLGMLLISLCFVIAARFLKGGIGEVFRT